MEHRLHGSAVIDFLDIVHCPVFNLPVDRDRVQSLKRFKKNRMIDNDQKVKKLIIYHHHRLLGLIHRSGIHGAGNAFGILPRLCLICNLSSNLFIVFKMKEVRPVE
jgi:hypothetical protein